MIRTRGRSALQAQLFVLSCILISITPAATEEKRSALAVARSRALNHSAVWIALDSKSRCDEEFCLHEANVTEEEVTAFEKLTILKLQANNQRVDGLNLAFGAQGPSSVHNATNVSYWTEYGPGWSEHIYDTVVARNGRVVPEDTIPCGIWEQGRQLQLDPDLSEFDSCEVVVVTAVTGGADAELRQTTPSASMLRVCFIAFLDAFTVEEMRANLTSVPGSPGRLRFGAWDVVQVGEMPYEDSRRNSRIFKHLPHVLFPKAVWSLWIDSVYDIMVDPVHLLATYLMRHKADMAFTTHYLRVRALDEKNEVVQVNLANGTLATRQFEHYAERGFHDRPTGIPYGSIIMRDHTSLASALMACAWFGEVVAHTPRDQLSFSYVLDRLGYIPSLEPEQFEAARDKGCLRALQFEYTSRLLRRSRVHMFPACHRTWVQWHAHKRKHLVVPDDQATS